MLQNLNDNELLALYKEKRQKEIVGVLYKRYTGFVFAVCMKYLKDEDTCKDAVMEIFEELFEKLLKHEISQFKAWLFIVAKNHCLHYIRKKKKFTHFEWQDNKNSEDFMENTPFVYLENETLTNKRLNDLMPAIQQLSKEQRVCIELFYLHDKSYHEVSDETGYDIKKVKSYIQNGKRNLKIQLLKENDA